MAVNKHQISAAHSDPADIGSWERTKVSMGQKHMVYNRNNVLLSTISLSVNAHV